MLKVHLKKTAKAFHDAGNAIDKYLAQLESMGLDLDSVKHPNLVIDVAMQIAEKTIQETLDSPLPATWDIYKGEIG